MKHPFTSRLFCTLVLFCFTSLGWASASNIKFTVTGFNNSTCCYNTDIRYIQVTISEETPEAFKKSDRDKQHLITLSPPPGFEFANTTDSNTVEATNKSSDDFYGNVSIDIHKTTSTKIVIEFKIIATGKKDEIYINNIALKPINNSALTGGNIDVTYAPDGANPGAVNYENGSTNPTFKVNKPVNPTVSNSYCPNGDIITYILTYAKNCYMKPGRVIIEPAGKAAKEITNINGEDGLYTFSINSSTSDLLNNTCNMTYHYGTETDADSHITSGFIKPTISIETTGDDCIGSTKECKITIPGDCTPTKYELYPNNTYTTADKLEEASLYGNIITLTHTLTKDAPGDRYLRVFFGNNTWEDYQLTAPFGTGFTTPTVDTPVDDNGIYREDSPGIGSTPECRITFTNLSCTISSVVIYETDPSSPYANLKEYAPGENYQVDGNILKIKHKAITMAGAPASLKIKLIYGTETDSPGTVVNVPNPFGTSVTEPDLANANYNEKEKACLGDLPECILTISNIGKCPPTAVNFYKTGTDPKEEYTELSTYSSNGQKYEIDKTNNKLSFQHSGITPSTENSIDIELVYDNNSDGKITYEKTISKPFGIFSAPTVSDQKLMDSDDNERASACLNEVLTCTLTFTETNCTPKEINFWTASTGSTNSGEWKDNLEGINGGKYAFISNQLKFKHKYNTGTPKVLYVELIYGTGGNTISETYTINNPFGTLIIPQATSITLDGNTCGIGQTDIIINANWGDICPPNYIILKNNSLVINEQYDDTKLNSEKSSYTFNHEVQTQYAGQTLKAFIKDSDDTELDLGEDITFPTSGFNDKLYLLQLNQSTFTDTVGTRDSPINVIDKYLWQLDTSKIDLKFIDVEGVTKTFLHYVHDDTAYVFRFENLEGEVLPLNTNGFDALHLIPGSDSLYHDYLNFDPGIPNLNYGTDNPNQIKYQLYKYTNGQLESCAHEQTIKITVIPEKIYIPKKSYCSNDSVKINIYVVTDKDQLFDSGKGPDGNVSFDRVELHYGKDTPDTFYKNKINNGYINLNIQQIYGARTTPLFVELIGYCSNLDSNNHIFYTASFYIYPPDNSIKLLDIDDKYCPTLQTKRILTSYGLKSAEIYKTNLDGTGTFSNSGIKSDNEDGVDGWYLVPGEVDDISDTDSCRINLKYYYTDSNGCLASSSKPIDIVSRLANDHLLIDQLPANTCLSNTEIELSVANAQLTNAYGAKVYYKEEASTADAEGNIISTVTDKESTEVTRDTPFYFKAFKAYQLEDMTLKDTTVTINYSYIDNNGCPVSNKHQDIVIHPRDADTTVALTGLKDKFCSVDDSVELKIQTPNTILDVSSATHSNVIIKNENRYYFQPTAIYGEGSTTIDDSTSNINVRYSYYDYRGCYWRENKEINIKATPIVSGLTINEQCLGEHTSFIPNMSSNTKTDKTLKYNWDFGDNDFLYTGSNNANTNVNMHNNRTRGTYASPKHEYLTFGSKTVNLSVTNENGCSASLSHTFNIDTNPEIAYKINEYRTTENMQISNLTTLVSGKIDSINWTITNDKQTIEETLYAPTDFSYNSDYPGINTIELTVTTQNGCASDSTFKVPVFPVIKITNDKEYSQYFETADDWGNGWIVDHALSDKHDSTHVWRHQSSTGIYADQSYSKGNIWLAGNPDLANSQAYIESPVFDIDNLDFPILSMDIFQSLEPARDGAAVLYTLDDGNSWKILGSTQNGENWYNAEISTKPGTSAINDAGLGWSKNANKWQTAHYSLASVKNEISDLDKANKKGVRFRIAYSSNNYTGGDYKGFAIANFVIGSGNRKVLLESFINSTYDAANPSYENKTNFDTLNTFTGNIPEQVIDIRYHARAWSGYIDPIEEVFTWQDASVRALEAEWVGPIWMVDNMLSNKDKLYTNSIEGLKDAFDNRTLKKPGVEIDNIQFSTDEGRVNISADITKINRLFNDRLGDHKILVRFIITQDEYVDENSNTYQNCMVDILPNGVGAHTHFINEDFNVDDIITVSDWWAPQVITNNSNYTLVVVAYTYKDGRVGEVQQAKAIQIPDVPVKTGISNKVVNSNSIEVYPNPVKDKLTVMLRGTVNKCDWQIINMTGQKCMEGSVRLIAGSFTINVASLHQGLYLLKAIDSNGAQYSIKFIVKI